MPLGEVVLIFNQPIVMVVELTTLITFQALGNGWVEIVI
jgi:hypothetical protein